MISKLQKHMLTLRIASIHQRLGHYSELSSPFYSPLPIPLPLHLLVLPINVF